MTSQKTKVTVWVRKTEGYRIQRVARNLGLYADVSNSPVSQARCSMTQAEAVAFLDTQDIAVLTVELERGIRFTDLTKAP